MLRTVTAAFLFFIMIVNEGQAQTAAGQMMIGGEISYYSIKPQARQTPFLFNVQSLTPNIGVRYHFGN